MKRLKLAVALLLFISVISCDRQDDEITENKTGIARNNETNKRESLNNFRLKNDSLKTQDSIHNEREGIINLPANSNTRGTEVSNETVDPDKTVPPRL